MRFALIAVLVLHGLIHLLGFVKEWRLAAVPQLAGATLFDLSRTSARVLGIGWLLVAVMMVISALLLSLDRPGWWIVAGVAAVASQLLITVYWADAKAGTIPNVIVVLVVLIAAAEWSFDRETAAETRALLSRAEQAKSITVSASDLARLPEPVASWLEHAGVVGRPKDRSVRLRQSGAMRTAPNSEWMPAQSVQYFSIDEPAFVWRTQVSMMKLIPIAGRDSYGQGEGRMLIKAAAIFPFVDAKDEKIAQGAMLRFLTEIVWFPSAALSSWVEWSPIDDRSARATMKDHGVMGSADFVFDEQHRLVEISALRFMGSGAEAKLERWSIHAREWAEMDGVLVPVAGDVAWKLDAGEFSYYEWRITELERDRFELYE